MPRRRVVLGVECLEARVVPAYWNPVYKDAGGLWSWTATGTGFVSGVVYTNWTTDSTAAPQDQNRIVEDSTQQLGWPGQYGTNGASSDTATFTGYNNTPMQTLGALANSLQGLTIGLAANLYTGVLTDDSDLAVCGSAAGFSMPGGEVDVGDGDTLEIKGGTSNTWSGGTIKAAGSLGLGDMKVTASNLDSVTSLGITGSGTSAGPSLLGCNLAITGNTANSSRATVIISGLNENLPVTSNKTITVNNGGTLFLSQENTDSTKSIGGLSSVGAASTNYMINIAAQGATLSIGAVDETTTFQPVTVDRAIANESGSFLIYAGYGLDISGADSNNFAYVQYGDPATLKIRCNTTTGGLLTVGYSMNINAGSINLMADPTNNYTEIGGTPLGNLKIYMNNSSEMYLTDDAADVKGGTVSIGAMQVLFTANTTLIEWTFGGNNTADHLEGVDGGSIVAGGSLNLTIKDNIVPTAAVTVLDADHTNRISGSFTTISDDKGNDYTGTIDPNGVGMTVTKK